jgi:acetylglutamate/LysW-gamma-L-alpha-aminoadipate kinase
MNSKCENICEQSDTGRHKHMTQVAEQNTAEQAQPLDNLLVVKLGGGAGLDMAASVADLATVAATRPLVIVHGVSAEANRLCEERGLPVRTITSPSGHSSRYTDATTRDVFVEAARNVNAEIISLLAEHGVTGQLVENTVHGQRKGAVRAVVNGRVRVIRDNYTGSITGVDAQPILDVLASGNVPVLPPEAFSAADGTLNVDGDRASAAVAAALGADDLVILSNVRGLYRNFPDASSFVDSVNASQIDEAMKWAKGRMKRKVLGAQEALIGGVTRVTIADGRIENPVQNALTGAGTVFTA